MTKISLRTYQEELKKLIFFKKKETTQSKLWGAAVPSRLEVYKKNARTNWMDALGHDYALTRRQFSEPEWRTLCKSFFIEHPPHHWELNASMSPFVPFLSRQNVKSYLKELADYEWHDLKVFIDRASVRMGSGLTNPTAVARVYQHQIFFWVQDGAPPSKPPLQKPEVLIFYRDSKNACHVQEADPLMLLMMDHFRKPHARLAALEPFRQRLLPDNKIPLTTIAKTLQRSELLLI